MPCGNSVGLTRGITGKSGLLNEFRREDAAESFLSTTDPEFDCVFILGPSHRQVEELESLIEGLKVTITFGIR